MADVAVDEELTELTEITAERVDAVKGAANGATFLLVKAMADDESLAADVDAALTKAEESTAAQNDLPDDAFAYIEPGGEKDEEGKTVPRSKRHFPVHDECLTGDTLIPLLDGRAIPIAELVGQDAWVYSFDCERQALVAGFAHDIRKTRVADTIVRVTLDNGESVDCTTNHPFLLRSGEYRLAQDLSAGDSLMPLYRRITPVRASKSKGLPGKPYEMVFQPYYRYWEMTHHMVDRATHGALLDGNVVHHRDDNQFNNRPDNLEQMSRAAHCAWHGEQFGERHWDRLRDSSARRWATPGAREAQAAVRRALNEELKASGRLPRKPMREWCSTRENAVAVYDRYLAGESLTALATELSVSVSGLKLGFARYGLPSKRQLALHGNHKVVAVAFREDPSDVYDMTVDEFHNFAVAAGVIVHNSHTRNALSRAPQSPFGDKAMPKIRAAAKKFGVEVSDDVAKADGGDGGDATPGSQAWETQDSALLHNAASMLARVNTMLAQAQDREQAEVEAGCTDDLEDVWDLDDAMCALDAALGVVGRLVYSEAAEALTAGDGNGSPMAKAGRRLSTKSEQSLKEAIATLTALLAGDGKSSTQTNDPEGAAGTDKEDDDMDAEQLAKALEDNNAKMAEALSASLGATLGEVIKGLAPAAAPADTTTTTDAAKAPAPPATPAASDSNEALVKGLADAFKEAVRPLEDRLAKVEATPRRGVGPLAVVPRGAAGSDLATEVQNLLAKAEAETDPARAARHRERASMLALTAGQRTGRLYDRQVPYDLPTSD